ncbi:MAG: hypothetical protein RBR50_05905 [Candidatus Izemoplasmatales bacterium]|nr:hypothetical protein [Candidatus Izemoplasmatales bacterium]
MKKLYLILHTLLLLILIGCTSKTFSYTGDYLDFYTEAIYTIPDTSGFMISEIYENPRIELIESDEYDRKLYTYFEGNNISTYSLLVMQYSTEDEVCFYSGKNFISSFTGEFNDDDIAKLKLENDWDTDLDENKCNCISITTYKEPLPLSYEQIKPFYEYVLPGDEHFSDDRWIKYFISDNYGRVLVTVESRYSDKWVVMLFNPDGTFDNENGYLILTDYYTYQYELETFKDNNGWNETLS